MREDPHTVARTWPRNRDGAAQGGCPRDTVVWFEPSGSVAWLDVEAQPLMATVRFLTSGTGIAGISISRTPSLKVATASSAFTCGGSSTRR